MLMQNFKTADELMLTERQFAALTKTLVLLETDALKHVELFDNDFPASPDARDGEFTGHFNMNGWNLQKTCGTVCCIGGTAELVGGLLQNELAHAAGLNPKLWSLFYPDALGFYDWNNIAPSQAARALRSYLTTGDADWRSAVQP